MMTPSEAEVGSTGDYQYRRASALIEDQPDQAGEEVGLWHATGILSDACRGRYYPHTIAPAGFALSRDRAFRVVGYTNPPQRHMSSAQTRCASARARECKLFSRLCSCYWSFRKGS